MKPWLACIVLSGAFATAAFAAQQPPEVVKSGQKISINADRVTLEHLLRLWDRVTGMHSTVPPELAKRVVTVRLTDVNVDEAARKIFEQEKLNYMLVAGQGVVVTGVKSDSTTSQAESETQQAVSEETPPEAVESAATREKPTVLPPPEPKLVWTPFGLLPKPSEKRQDPIQLPPVQSPPPPPFFAQPVPVPPPAGAPNGPAYNSLFGAPTPVYQAPVPVLPTR